MKRRAHITGNFVAVILLPLVLTTICTTLVSISMLNGISNAVNRQEDQRTWDAVSSAFTAARQQMSAIATDNARWDDAAERTKGKADQNWIYDNWGAATADQNYDTVFVISPSGSVLAAYHEGAKINLDPSTYYKGSFRRLIGSTHTNSANFKVLDSLAWTPNGLAAVATAPIVPYTYEQNAPANKLVLSRTLGPQELLRIGRQYVVDGLVVHDLAQPVAGARALFTNWGAPVATVTWIPKLPGDAARSSYKSLAFASVLAMIFVLLPISIVHAKTINRLQRNEIRERESARQDPLSQLPNRLGLLEVLKEQLAEVNGQKVSLLFIDLDGFKAINDAYDHETGDKLIRAVAAGLGVLAGETGFVARLGGDEFAILLVGDDVRLKSEKLAQNVLEFVKDPFEIDGRVAAIGASIGIADTYLGGADPNELMRRADIAMYDAKDRGGNKYRRFVSSLDTRRNEDLAIASELREHIDAGSIEIAYQPIVDARTHTTTGVEALARWPQSSHRDLCPDRFIAVAEEFGLISSLGNNLLRKACRELAPRSDLMLSVNVSPLQIGDPRFVDEIVAVLREHAFPPSRLEVEITEGVLIKNPGRAKKVVRELQLQGISVALDDFGAGYASIGYLREFEFNKIKLDRTLTQAIEKNPSIQRIVQGTVLIADGMSASIVAEGVETAYQANLMKLAGCSYLQGYHFGKPQRQLPPPVADEVLDAKPIAVPKLRSGSGEG